MRRSGVLSLLIALVLLPWSASAVAQDVVVSLVTVEVPTGAARPGATITVEVVASAERPEELAGLPMTSPFHELRPLDARFSEPVTVTRLIEFSQLGITTFDPTQQGLVVGSLFTRDADGVWSWLDDAEVRVDLANEVFVVTATMDHGGPIIGFIGANLVVAPEDPPESAVGEVFQVEGLLRAQALSAADVAAGSASTSDPAVAALIRSYDVEFFDRAVGLEFKCLAPGTVSYTVTFTVTSVADVSPLNEPIDLGGTDVDVTYMGEHSCVE